MYFHLFFSGAVQNTYKAAECNIGFEKRHQHIIMVDHNRKKIRTGANRSDFLEMRIEHRARVKQKETQSNRARHFCDLCNSSFTREVRLKKHKKRNHKVYT